MNEPIRTVDSCHFHKDPGDASSVEIIVEGFDLSLDIRIAEWSMKGLYTLRRKQRLTR